MVFDPQAPPSDRNGFISWYEEQTQWNKGHLYDSLEISTSTLRAWYEDMLKDYPALNGPDSTDDVDNPKVIDYSIGKSAIYAAFAWSEAKAARGEVFRPAEKHRVGFLDVNDENGGVLLPTASGSYVCVSAII
jgi:hypothetical protein